MNTQNTLVEKAKALCGKIIATGHDALIVGGAVRDMVMCKDVHDVDIATSMPIKDLHIVFSHTNSNNGEKHGTILVHEMGEAFEVTQFRTESTYSDGRRPDEVLPAETFLEDSQRRDFTINAMGLRVDGTIVDYHGGLQDIQQQLIRTVGDANERFAEDYLRMLRAIRFASRYGWEIESNTLKAIQEHGHQIAAISRERITAEITKVAEYGPKAFYSFVRYCIQCNISQIVFGKSLSLKQFEDESYANMPQSATLGQLMWSVYIDSYFDLKQLKFPNKLDDEVRYYRKFKNFTIYGWWDIRTAEMNPHFDKLVELKHVFTPNLSIKTNKIVHEFRSAKERGEKFLAGVTQGLLHANITGEDIGLFREKFYNEILDTLVKQENKN